MFISVGSTYVSQIHGISAVSSEGVIAQLSPYLSIKTVLHCSAVMGRNSSGLNPKKNRAAASRKDKKKWPHRISGNWHTLVQQIKPPTKEELQSRGWEKT